jgi:hypothetical protein
MVCLRLTLQVEVAVICPELSGDDLWEVAWQHGAGSAFKRARAALKVGKDYPLVSRQSLKIESGQ